MPGSPSAPASKSAAFSKARGWAHRTWGRKPYAEFSTKTNTKPEDVELLICATTTPDFVHPCTANLICDMVGIRNVGSFDIQAACSGFIYALTVARQFIVAGTYKKIIVVGADKMSAIVDYTDRATCVLFGDGAGAVMLEPNSEGYGIMDTILRSDGSGAKHLHQKAGGSRMPPTAETVAKRMHYVYQEGAAVYKYAVAGMAEVTRDIMARNNLRGDMIDWVVPHQANRRIIETTAERLGLPPDKVMYTIHKYGNTTTATIPLSLWDYEDKLKVGDRLLLAAFGGGFTWGGAYLTWAYDGAKAQGAEAQRQGCESQRHYVARMSKHRVGIVGLGMALKPHLKSLEELSSRVEIAACFTQSAERRKAFAAANKHPVVDGLDTILADRSIDIVFLLTPPMTHLDLVERCAAAGKHVLLEKPTDVTSERAAKAVAAMDKAGRKFGIMLQHRFRDASRKLRDAVQGGELGALVSASASIRWWRPPGYFAEPGRGMMARDGGGVLITQAIHTLDLFQSLTGKIAKVTAFAKTSPLRKIDTEDIVAAGVEFSNGAIGTIDATTVAYPGFPERIELAGEKAHGRAQRRDARYLFQGRPPCAPRGRGVEKRRRRPDGVHERRAQGADYGFSRRHRQQSRADGERA